MCVAFLLKMRAFWRNNRLPLQFLKLAFEKKVVVSHKKNSKKDSMGLVIVPILMAFYCFSYNMIGYGI